jgi:hypothetical protein
VFVKVLMGVVFFSLVFEYVAPGILLREVVVELPPLSWLWQAWYVPATFRSVYKFDPPVSHLDGLKLLGKLAPLPQQSVPLTRSSRAKMAIAVPILNSQWGEIIPWLRTVMDNAAAPHLFDIVLFFNKDEAAVRSSALAEAKKLVEEAGGSLQIFYSRLSPSHDRYFLLNAAGPMYQWLHAIQSLDQAGYKAFMIMETGVHILQKGFDVALAEQFVDSKEQWWIAGSIWYLWRPTNEHLNGNAMYRLGDNGLYVFIWEGIRHESWWLNYVRAYDLVLFDMTWQISHSWKYYSHLVHRFKATSMIVNLSLMPCITADVARKRHPAAYVAHFQHEECKETGSG